MMSAKIIEQPTFDKWFDARVRASELAQQYGFAVIVVGRSGGEIDIEVYRVIPGVDSQECEDLAADCAILLEFDQYGHECSASY